MCIPGSIWTKPKTVKLLDVSRTYWQRRGVQDWGLVIDCTRCTMPVWKDGGELQGYEPCTEEMLREQTGIVLCKMEELDADRKKTAYERFTWIAGILPFLAEDGKRSRMIAALAAQGSSRITHTEFIDRGYADFAQKLTALGGQIARETPHGADCPQKRTSKT